MGSDRPYDMMYFEENLKRNPEGKTNFRVALPDEINEELQWYEKEYVDIEKEPGENDLPEYLRADKVPPENIEKREHYKISRHNGRLFLTIPADWRDDFVKHDGNEQLVVEINLAQGSDHLRIYRLPEYHEKRRPYLKQEGFKIEKGEPLIFPFLTTSGLGATLGEEVETDPIDLTFSEASSKQKFRLIMYDAQHPIFQEDTAFRGENHQPSPSRRQEIVENNELPRYPAQTLRIEWAESPTEGSRREIYNCSDGPIVQLDIMLSEVGIYTIYSETERGEMSAWVRYGDENEPRMYYVGKGWGGTCLSIPENQKHLNAYIPCQTISE